VPLMAALPSPPSDTAGSCQEPTFTGPLPNRGSRPIADLRFRQRRRRPMPQTRHSMRGARRTVSVGWFADLRWGVSGIAWLQGSKVVRRLRGRLRTNRRRGDRLPCPLLRFAVDNCRMLYNAAQTANGSCFQKVLPYQHARQSAWRGFPGPPSTCNALTFTEEARRRSIYWLASWLAQNLHL
jgi:hypothetical protein